jgi:hypothetical protein
VTRALLVAGGGSGDAITAAALRRVLDLDGGPVVLTYSWDRLLVDPLPGPRTAADFVGLGRPAPDVLQVTPTTTPVAPAGSSLPRLAAELPARLLLLDPSAGAVSMATQVAAAAAHAGAGEVVVVDVGGDVLTDGRDFGLRSPLADQLAVAACLRAGLPTRLVMTGLGVDGEIEPPVLRERLARFGGDRIGRLADPDLADVRRVFGWHPSEASGLLVAAVAGCRGRVEVRDAGDLVPLGDDTPDVHAVDLKAAASHLPAAELVATSSLDQAVRLVLGAPACPSCATRRTRRLDVRPASPPSPRAGTSWQPSTSTRTVRPSGGRTS